MKTFLKRIDVWACWLLIPFFALCRLVGRCRAVEEGKTLYVRPGGMGDLICLDIALRQAGVSLRDVCFLIEKRSEPWAKFRGMRYWCYDRGIIGVVIALAGRFAEVVNTEQRFGLSMCLAWSAGAAGAYIGCLSTNRAACLGNSKTEYDAVGTHEVVSFKKLITALYGSPKSLRPLCPLRTYTSDRLCVAFSSAMVHGHRSRSFPTEQWARWIIRWAVGQSEIDLVCPACDEEYARAVVQMVTRVLSCKILIHANAFTEQLEIVRRAKRLLAVDGGMVHVASFFGVPTDAIFTSGRDMKWAPLAPASRIFSAPLGCRPCVMFGQLPDCSHGFACRDVGVEPAVEHVLRRVVRETTTLSSTDQKPFLRVVQG